MTELLTIDQKKAIIACNYGIAQFGRYIDEDAYGDSPSWVILERWLNEILQLDYRTEIYNNPVISELNRLDSVKNAFRAKYNDGWFIGDALKNSLYTLVHNNVQDEKVILAKEGELKEMWIFFQSLLPKPKTHVEYELVGELNGELLYRRVKK